MQVDLTTLVTLGSLFFGIIVGNAALFGESLYASVNVSKTLADTGFDRPTAEQIFASEIAWYGRLPSVLATPSVTTSSAPSFAMALAQPFGLQDMVRAIQIQVRSDVVSVSGAVTQDGAGKPLRVVMVITNPPEPP